MNEAYLLTGSNLGDRLSFLTKAAEAIEQRCGRIEARSAVYETAAWGREDQPSFLNQVLRIRTQLEAGLLIKEILDIESGMGRKRVGRYAPRAIDIDILFYDDAIIDMPGLSVPHPQMQNRRFVLVPLAEIAALKIHPVLHRTVSELLEACEDPLAVNKFN